MPGVAGMVPLGAYAFAANGLVTAKYTFVDANGAGSPIITIALFPRTVTSWTWLPQGAAQQNATLSVGAYKFPDVWLYGDGYIVNVLFVKPVPWVFLGPWPPQQATSMTATTTATTATTTTAAATSTATATTTSSTTTTSPYVWG
ncbi:MAG: hypothetical protein ACP5I3_00645 [Thermoproteus sp.]